MKTCNVCKTEKDPDDFPKRTAAKDGRDWRCRSCAKAYYSLNKSTIAAQKKKYNLENKDKLRPKKQAYQLMNKENKKEYDVEYRKNNWHKIREYKLEWEKKNRNNPLFKIKRNLRRRINHVVKGHRKSERTEELIGCSFKEFINHIERQFKVGMSWDNYGITGWHIDHIIPCYKFDLSKPEQQKECFHFSNQRPLWAQENLSRPRD
jgi:hypothetical protein